MGRRLGFLNSPRTAGATSWPDIKIMVSQLPLIDCYIFDPQEVQATGYINEINNYKSDRQDGGKYKGKQNTEIQVHKNELQNAEVQPSGNRNKLNNTKDALQNHRNTALHEEGLHNGFEKSNIHINGVHPYLNLKSNHNANQNKEVSIPIGSVQLPIGLGKELSPPEQRDDTILETGPPKLPSETVESSRYRQFLTTGGNGSLVQGAVLEAQSNGICSSDPDFSQNGGQQTVVGSESLSNHHTHSTQTTEHTVLDKHGDPESHKTKRCDSGGRACGTGTSNGCLEDKLFSDIPSPRPQPEDLPGAEQVCCGEINGEFDEQDEDVAEALAALEAATAGEDSEEEEEY